MSPEELARLETVARDMMAYDEAGGAAAEEEDKLLRAWDDAVTPEAVLRLVQAARGVQLPQVAAG